MKACLEFPRLDYADADAHYLEALLNLLADMNAAWYLEQWAQGRDPPCCAGCAELQWVEPKKASSQTFHAAPTLTANPRKGWSCGEIAALDAGVKRAKAIRDGGAGADVRVLLQHTGDRQWHAVVQTPSGIHDPSRDKPAKRAYAVGALVPELAFRRPRASQAYATYFVPGRWR